MASFVTVFGPDDRVRQFEQVFGTTTVPVRERLPLASLASLPEVGWRPVYMLDLDALDALQLERLIAYGMQRFGMSRDECERELPHGFPILAENTTFASDGLDFL